MPQPWIKPALDGEQAARVREQLVAILDHYHALSPSLSDGALKNFVAGELSQAVAKTGDPWGGRYLTNILAARIVPSHKLAEATARLGAMLDGLPPVIASAEKVSVYVVVDGQSRLPHPIREGSLIYGTSRKCANPDCPIWFVPNNARRKYCYRCSPPGEPFRRPPVKRLQE
jgi:hypothetical protein